MKRYVIALLILISLLLPAVAQAQQPAVQAILFYSPNCPHCHDVIDNVLPPLKAQYGEQLQLVGIDTTKASGQQLYEAAYTRYAPPETSRGVPALLVGDVYLVGSVEIPERFPGLIEEGLRNGGTPWPDLPGLREAIPDLPPDAGSGATAVATPAASAANGPAVLTDALAGETAAPAETPSGMALAWLVMAALVGSLAYVVWRWFVAPRGLLSVDYARLSGWLIPLLALAGLGVALYLAYIEVTHSTAVCGPVGDCNAVQSSPYAAIFGIPIAVLGVLNYLGILGLWAVLRLTAPRPVPWAAAALGALTVAGTVFSIYLTGLELLVINAVCAWCLSSAIITAVLMVVVITALLPQTKPGQERAAAVR